jgi:hypothetical protein
VLEKNGQKAPWKFLDSIEIEGLSFGLVPPAFQVASAKFDPTVSTLTLSMDVRFTSNSAQAVVRKKQQLLATSYHTGIHASGFSLQLGAARALTCGL